MARQNAGTSVGFGPFRFDLQTHALTKDHEPIKIPHRLALILKCLIQRRPHIVRCIDPTLSDVFASMGANTEQMNVNFRKYMSDLRSLLGHSEFDKNIMSHRKKTKGEAWGGYSFVGTVVSEHNRNRTSTMRQSLLPILKRNDLDALLGRPEERIAAAHEEIWISGNDNAYVGKSISNFLEDALESGKKLRLLGVAPRKHLVEALSLIDPRFAKGNFNEEVDSVTRTVKNLHEQYPQFEYRLLPLLPAQGFFITDPHLPNRTVKVEIYTAQPWQPLNTRPHFVIPRQLPDWQEYFIKQFENYWALSQCPFKARLPKQPTLLGQHRERDG